VVGIPCGGAEVAVEVGQVLGAPLDVVCVAKLSSVDDPDFAFGAVAEGGVRFVNTPLARALGVDGTAVEAVGARAERDLDERCARLRGLRPRISLEGRTAILVDDGIATGSSAVAAARSLRERGASKIVMASPVASQDGARLVAGEVDEVVFLEQPEVLVAISMWYRDFDRVSGAAVGEVLTRSASINAPTSREVTVATNGVRLPGDLSTPRSPIGAVIFAHGSGSGRASPRNTGVARTLNEAGFATLLFDLLTLEETCDRDRVFDIPLLASRLVAATHWLRGLAEVWDVPIGYFGASTGAAAALWAAAEPVNAVSAVVSRGGRPDLAGPRLASVTAPTLLIVGGHDERVLALNEKAQRRMTCESRLEIVAGATHLFEEWGALEMVATLAGHWFTRHLGAAARVA
jgi:predicted phosphoribosyltransferase/dienelactone hydrolase